MEAAAAGTAHKDIGSIVLRRWCWDDDDDIESKCSSLALVM